MGERFSRSTDEVAASRVAWSWRRAPPWVVLAAGLVFAGYMLTLTRPGAFFSGDAGAKVLLVQQFARGDLSADLRLPAAPWVRELWDQGFYPFRPPFVYRVDGKYFSTYPVLFPLLTAPAYALLGWRGLYLWPVIGLLAIWLALLYLGRKLQLGPAWTALALFALVFASPLTLYGAMFWEHTMGVALAFWGLALLFAPGLRSPLRNGLLAGLLLGLSVSVRSEMVWLAAVTVSLLPFASRLGPDSKQRAPFLAGLAIAAISLLSWNTFAYGTPFGMHSRVVTAGFSLAERVHGAVGVSSRLLLLLVRHFPAAFLAVAIGLLLRGHVTNSQRRQMDAWTFLTVAFTLGVAMLLPGPSMAGDGGYQLGPRFLLVVMPMASLVLGLGCHALWRQPQSMQRWAWVALLALAVVKGTRVNIIRGTASLASNYSERVSPLVEEFRRHPEAVLVAFEDFIPLEVCGGLGTSAILLAAGEEELRRLAPLLFDRGVRGAYLVTDRTISLAKSEPFMARLGAGQLEIRPMQVQGIFHLHELKLTPLP
jgi:hypothetical protein